MKKFKAKCDDCGHIWGVTSKGSSICPKCGSKAVKFVPKPFADSSPQGFAAFVVRMESPGGVVKPRDGHTGLFGGQPRFWCA